MKLLFLLFLPPLFLGISQKLYETKKVASNTTRNGTYVSSTSWMISKGEEVQFAQGSMPEQSFVYITAPPTISALELNVNYDIKKLSEPFSGRKAIIKDLMNLVNKRPDFIYH